METYGFLLRDTFRSVADRLLGRDVSTRTERISYDEVQRLLEEMEEVCVTRLPAGIVPATTHRMEGGDAATAWAGLDEAYTLHEPVLKTTCRGGECTYAIQVRYERDELYGGEYRFRVDEDTR